jgi:hypothetical protein
MPRAAGALILRGTEGLRLAVCVVGCSGLEVGHSASGKRPAEERLAAE